MSIKKQNNELDELKADIASLRQEIAALASVEKKSSGEQSKQSHAKDQQDDPSDDKEGFGMWADLLNKLDLSKVQGEKVISGLTVEVEKHPLASIMASFGIGYIIARLRNPKKKQ